MKNKPDTLMSRVRQAWGRLSGLAHGLITPLQEYCLCCGKSRDSNDLPLCRDCANVVPWITQVRCLVCGRHEDCADCGRRKNTFFVCNRSAVCYDRTMKEWLARFKYRGDERLQTLFVSMMSPVLLRLLREMNFNGKDGAVPWLTYVPLSPARLEERGFNQAEAMARGLGAKFALPVIALLSRTRHTDKQSYKTRTARVRDMHGAFTFDPRWRLHLPDPTSIIIVDDVYTTGSTLNECARLIRFHTSLLTYGLTWSR